MGKTDFYAHIMTVHKEVTGSCIMTDIKFPNGRSKKLLVDCGLFQEQAYSDQNKSLPFDASNIDYVLVTHNHVDHTGRLPFLVRSGYTGDIHMSNTTAKLLPYALGDSYKVLSTRAKLSNEPKLYTDSDVELTLRKVKAHNFEESFYLDENLKVTFFMNGHLPGAVIILLQIKYRNDPSGKRYEDINILYTGDYSPKNIFFDVKPLPKWIYKLPITIVQESTYGDMDSTSIERVFERNVLTALEDGKDVVIPVFSLGRAQEIMYTLKYLQDQDKLDKSIPIYFDGKLGMNYTNLYLYDGLDNNIRDFLPANFHPIIGNTELRNSIMNDNVQKIILPTGGMGSHGPAQTYIPTYLKRPNTLIHFTGYCSEGTLGRELYECEAGETIDVCGLQVKKLADVQFTSEFSAHAKANELIAFLKPFEDLKLVLINHGESDTKKLYADRVINEIDPKNVGILEDYLFKVDAYGFVKAFTTKF